MKVLHVIPSMSFAHGGPSHAIRLTERALRMQGIEVETVTTDDDGPGERSGKRIGVPLKENGVVRRYFPKWLEFYKCTPGLARWVNRHVLDYDLVHIHALFSFSSVAAAWAARSAGVPYVVRPLGTLNRYGVEKRRPLLKKLSLKFIEGPILRHAAAVHFTAEAERLEAEALGIPMKSVVIPLGIEALSPSQPPPQVGEESVASSRIGEDLAPSPQVGEESVASSRIGEDLAPSPQVGRVGVGKNLDDQIVPLPASPTSGGGEQGPLPAGGGGGGEGKANCLALPRRNGAGVQASHWTGWGGEKENPFLAQYPQLAGARIVLYLSRLDPKKNVEGLLRAFSLLGKPDPANPPSTMSRAIWEEKARETRGHGLMLVIAGEGEPGYVAGLHRLARELGLGEQVLWVGQLGGDVKAAAYAAAKIFALPSFSENFGIAAAEALSAGLPCVLGKGVAISGEVAEAGAGLAVAPEPKAIADALRKLLEDENLRADMGRRAAELAAERYTLEAMGTRLKELYSRILSEKQSEQIE